MPQKFLQFHPRIFRKANFAQRLDRLRVEQPQNNFFAGDRWIRGNADIVLDLQFFVGNSTVLRQRFLVGFQTGQEFDSSNNAVGHVGGQFQNRRDDAVEPERDFGGMSSHLEMDVTGPGPLGLANELFQDLRRG